MKIIQTKFKDMPSSLMVALGSYRCSFFACKEGWLIPERSNTPGQEYDQHDRSEVIWLIAWAAHYGICGCARLITRRIPDPPSSPSSPDSKKFQIQHIWEMSRFSARLDLEQELPLEILWHALHIAERKGAEALLSTVTPMLEKMFIDNNVEYQNLT